MLATAAGCASTKPRAPVQPVTVQPVTVQPIALTQTSVVPAPALAQPIPTTQPSLPPQPLPEGLPPRGPGEELPRLSPDGLTLNDLEYMALGSNPSLARAQAAVAAARGYWVQVGLPNNPLVGYLGAQLGSGGLAEQHAAMFEQEFITGGKRRLNRAEAEHESSSPNSSSRPSNSGC